jgi:hypothetical protein
MLQDGHFHFTPAIPIHKAIIKKLIRVTFKEQQIVKLTDNSESATLCNILN